MIDGVDHGRTPLSVNLRRKQRHLIRIEWPDYPPADLRIERKVSGAFWGNWGYLLMAGAGMIVDALSGAMFDLQPNSADVVKNRASIQKTKEGIQIAVHRPVLPEAPIADRAEEGNVAAMEDLARRYHVGDRVPKDHIKALMWATIAATLTRPGGEYSNLQGTVARRMSERDVDEAQRLAREWLDAFEKRKK